MELTLFNKTFKIALFSFFIASLLSFIFFYNTRAINVLFLSAVALVFIFSLKKPEYGLYLVLGELFIGSKGYLFFLSLGSQKISLRIGLFAAVMLAWLFKMLWRPQGIKAGKKTLIALSILSVFIILSALSGLLNNSPLNWFLDLNGWLYFLLAPVFFSVIKEKKIVGSIVNILLAATIFLSLETLLIFIFYAWSPTFGLSAAGLYYWLRNAGLAEITFVYNNFYRVFFQSQLYAVMGLLTALTFLVVKQNHKSEKRWLWITLILSSLSILISLSRSFWLGLIGALLALIICLSINRKVPYLSLAKYIVAFCLIIVLEMGLLLAVSKTFQPKIFFGRLAEASAEAAGSSRLNQLKPLWTEIKESWILGKGFGATATYKSNDPRIRATHPDGLYTAYAFEWGYLDIWLKTGALGLLAYLWLYWLAIKQNLALSAQKFALFLGLIALFIASIFSPYLNHPLGIGFLLVALAASQTYQTNERT